MKTQRRRERSEREEVREVERMKRLVERRVDGLRERLLIKIGYPAGERRYPDERDIGIRLGRKTVNRFHCFIWSYLDIRCGRFLLSRLIQIVPFGGLDRYRWQMVLLPNPNLLLSVLL